MNYYIIRDKDAHDYDPLMVVKTDRPFKDEIEDAITEAWQDPDYNTEMLRELICDAAERWGVNVEIAMSDEFESLYF